MTDEQIAKAEQMRDGGMTYQKIGDAVGVPYSTVYYNLNPVARQCDAIYCHTHRPERRRYDVVHYQRHRVEEAQRNAEYHRTHKSEIAQRKAIYYQDHKVGIIQQKNVYRRNHLPEGAAITAKRRALKTGAIIGATIKQLNEIKEVYRRAKEDLRVRCYLCGKLIPKGHRHVDHIVPLSKGGTHRPSNLAVACDICNMRKHDKLPEEIGVLL